MGDDEKPVNVFLDHFQAPLGYAALDVLRQFNSSNAERPLRGAVDQNPSLCIPREQVLAEIKPLMKAMHGKREAIKVFGNDGSRSLRRH